MITEVLKVDPYKIYPEIMRKAAKIIRSGGLVAFPTETVYGLGASAFDERAVEKIFEAKGRPQDNPLIVHVASVEQAKDAVLNINSVAGLLMEKFWPGPLTLVMHKSDKIPFKITAGLDTVAVRMPSHPVARELIKYSGVPIVAPSA
ncbi:MAG: L-threonylcarbamoyladenylate synthase, partial [Eubacteriales bacterium]|nr:L-threonylcarbamoyladenylate synthase [Eubacteriales bacterium]